MSKIINTTRGLVRPTRQPDDPVDARDLAVAETALAPIKGREARALVPITSKSSTDERREGGGFDNETLAPLPAPRGLASDLVVARNAPVTAKSPVSSFAVGQLIGALEQHGQRASVSHEAALGVLKRLQALVEQVTERRSWPRVPRVRRRVQRRRREG
jgi:hypothetical protein